jgi:acyl-CoA thioester hydrolase
MADAAARAPRHVHGLRVYYEDTDVAGIVYYANHLKYAERARTEMMRAAGATHAEMIERHGIAFAVRHCAVDYRRPAKLDDWLEVETRITGIGAATVDALQLVRRDGETLAELKVQLVCVDRAGRAQRLPAPARAALLRFMQSEESESP